MGTKAKKEATASKGRNMRKKEDRPVVYWLTSCAGKLVRSRVKDDLRLKDATPLVKVVLPPMSKIPMQGEAAVHANETLALQYSKSIQE